MSTIKVDTVRPVTTDGSLTLQGDSSGSGVSGITIDSSGDTTLSGNLVIPDGGTIGSASDTDAITIDSSGKVGIGVTSPDQLLHVSGDVAEVKLTNTNPIEASGGTEQVFKIGVEGQKNNVYGPAGSIIFRQDDTWSSAYASYKPTAIEFCTQDSSTTDNSGTPRMRIDSSGNLEFNSGYGSVATAYGCRAWVNFDGTSGSGTGYSDITIRGSGNVTSITDNGTGKYTVNFTTAMTDTNYSVIATAKENNNTTVESSLIMAHTTAVDSCKLMAVEAGVSITDCANVFIAIFR